jgi:hypothetical protein
MQALLSTQDVNNDTVNWLSVFSVKIRCGNAVNLTCKHDLAKNDGNKLSTNAHL